MYDLSLPNDRPGECSKCHGTGLYRWGPVVNGAPKHIGDCHSCRGSGKQDLDDIRRNRAYNRHKVALILSREG